MNEYTDRRLGKIHSHPQHSGEEKKPCPKRESNPGQSMHYCKASEIQLHSVTHSYNPLIQSLCMLDASNCMEAIILCSLTLM